MAPSKDSTGVAAIQIASACTLAIFLCARIIAGRASRRRALLAGARPSGVKDRNDYAAQVLAQQVWLTIDTAHDELHGIFYGCALWRTKSERRVIHIPIAEHCRENADANSLLERHAWVRQGGATLCEAATAGKQRSCRIGVRLLGMNRRHGPSRQGNRQGEHSHSALSTQWSARLCFVAAAGAHARRPRSLRSWESEFRRVRLRLRSCQSRCAT